MFLINKNLQRASQYNPEDVNARVENLRRRWITNAILTSTLVFAACAPSPDIEFRPTGVEHIVNGQSLGSKAASKNEPLARSVVALVAIHQDSEALCTGTILSDDIILTAAHCVENNPEKMAVIFSQNLKPAPATTGLNPDVLRRVDRFAENPGWGKQSANGRGDLALVHFAGGLPAGFSPVRLATPGIELELNTGVRMLGYGVTDGIKNKGAGVLRETETTVMSSLSPTEIVTDGRKSSVCFGDSGGPAFSMQNGLWVQWGVASSVMNQECNQASIHTEVMSYLSWIKATAAKLSLK